MARRGQNDYANNYATAERTDFRDEEVEHRPDHENDHDSTWARENQHLMKFSDELQQVNEQVALDFDRRKNPAEYTNEERREMLEAVEHAFNSTDWNSALEKRSAADDIAQNMFQPMYHRIEIAEAAAQHQFSEDFVRELKNEKIEYLERKIDDDGLPTEVLEFQVKDYDTALRMVEESKGTFHIVTTNQMDHYRERFADALYNSQWDENSQRMMEEQLGSAIAYYNGDMPRTNRFGRGAARLMSEGWDPHEKKEQNEHPTGDESLEELWGRDNDQKELSYREQLAFSNLESMNEYELDQEIREILNGALHHTQEYLSGLKATQHPDQGAIQQTVEATRDMSHSGLQGSVENGNQENFALIMRNMEGMDRELAEEFGRGEGFIEAEGYEQPGLVERFTNPDEMAEYADQAEDTLEELKETMSVMHQNVARNLLDKLDRRLNSFENIREEWNNAGFKPGDQVPEGVTHPDTIREEFEDAHRIAQGLDYLLRPKDPDTWNVWNENGTNHIPWSGIHQVHQKYREYAQERYKYVFEEDPERGKLFEIGMNTINSELHRTTEHVRETRQARGDDQPEGRLRYNEAAEFVTDYSPLIEEAQKTTEYAKIIAERTSDITLDLVWKPIEEFKFNPSLEANEDAQRGEHIDDMTTFGVHYANICGNGANNVEGGEDSMKLLQYASNEYQSGMADIRELNDRINGWNTSDATGENDQECQQWQEDLQQRMTAAGDCSRLMTSLVSERQAP